MMLVRMIEMPVGEMEENINAELNDNPALERITDSEDIADNNLAADDDGADGSFEEQTEREERKDALDAALERIGDEEEIPLAYQFAYANDADTEERTYGNTTSFYDRLKEQMGMETLDEVQQAIMEYLIGSLEEDGLLHKSIDTICDELAIYNNIDVPESEIRKILGILQTFDPAGVGARSLQECLLLQIDRRTDGPMKELMKKVISHHFKAFTRKHWDKIKQELLLTDSQAQALMGELVKLNPKPGASLGETEGRSLQQITPDFIVDTAEDGTINFSLNRGNIPELRVSGSFVDMVDTYKKNKASMNRQDKEAMLYAKEKIERAMSYIRAVKQRNQTLAVTMQAIIDWQQKFFADGDESELRPMVLKNIAAVTGLDISTISRVANEKYVQTQWGIFPLKFFFSDGYVTSSGEETSTRRLKLALKELIDNEDKHRPLSDDELADRMKEQGFPVARRTIAKYRTKLGIPVARLRK